MSSGYADVALPQHLQEFEIGSTGVKIPPTPTGGPFRMSPVGLLANTCQFNGRNKRA